MASSDLIPIQNTEKFVVTQSNDLIEADYFGSITTRAHKVARLILALINPKESNLTGYTVTVKELQKYLGMNRNTKWGDFHREIKGIYKELSQNVIEIRKPDGGTIQSPLVVLETTPRDATVTFHIPPPLLPYLIKLKKNYTSYLLINIPKLRSGYSIRLYELLHQYRKIAKRYFAVDDLQKKVGSNYKLYGDFKRNVLNKAQKDLKKHTDLAFAFDERKQGRKVIGIEFIIFGNTPEKKQPDQLSFLDDAIHIQDNREKPALSETIIKGMNELGISEQNIAKYLAMGFDIIDDKKANRVEVQERCKTLENYYLEKLELTKHSAKTDKAAGYFISALKEDWTNNNTLKKSKQEKAAKEIREARKQLDTTQSKLDKLSRLRESKKAPIIAELIAEEEVLQTAYDTTLAKMGSFMKKHIANVLHLPIKEQYEQAIAIGNGINIYLMENYPNRFEEVAAITTKIEQAEQEIKALRAKYPSLR